MGGWNKSGGLEEISKINSGGKILRCTRIYYIAAKKSKRVIHYLFNANAVSSKNEGYN